MAELLGRTVTISIGSPLAVVATARTKNLSINNEVIDVTADGDSGVRRYLSQPGEKAVDVSVDGMFDSADATLLDLSLNGSDVSIPVSFDFGTYTVSGTFVMPSFSMGLPYKEAVTFSATFNSSGAVVKSA